MKTFLNELNEEQRKAVEVTDGPILILAGAGSGKTRALTYKIALLISKGIDPFNILALTFTNKAAKEMKERVSMLLGSGEARNVWLGTFHSVFARILRREGERLGYPTNFTIYDTEDSKKLIKSIVKSLELDDKAYKASSVLGRISSAKSSLISASDYNKNVELLDNDNALQRPRLGEIYTIYAKKCFRASAMDFDDLLLNMNILLRDYPEVLNKYQRQFKYILVDEYQDTNFAQYVIIKKLAANNENITVVGDDAQSIYGFRGANIENILNLKKDYPELKIFKLEQNYRSTQNIVNAANSIILNNKKQFKKEIWTENEKGNPIKILKAATDNEEGRKIADYIAHLKISEDTVYKDFAILYRTNAQSRALEEGLSKAHIPYRIFGSISFYQRKEVKDLIAYFRLVINTNDDEALLRIINYPARGLGKVTIERIIVEADKDKISLWQLIRNLNQYNIDINQGARRKIEEFVYMILSFSTYLETKNAYELGHLIADKSGILKDLFEDKSPEGVSRYDNISELLSGIKLYTEEENNDENEENDESNKSKTLAHYIQDVSLLTDADKDDKNTDVVSLMTIHMAKGLEFPFVFLSGLEENLFPSLMALNTRSELEEERRLFYVAVTRAMKKLFISYAESRYKWGNQEYCEPSRFIDEIDPKHLDYSDIKTKAHYQRIETEKPKNTWMPDKNKTAQMTAEILGKNFKKVPKVSDSGPINTNYNVGMVVEHERFGKGKIISIEGASDNIKAIVLFDKEGQKQLLLKYAKLKIIE